MKEGGTMEISEKILRLRQKRGMTQEKLAARVGVGRDTVDRWEKGLLKPDAVHIRRLSGVLDIEPGYFSDRRPSLLKVINIHLDRITKRHRLAVVVTAAVSLLVAFLFLLLAMDHLTIFFGIMALISVVVSCLSFMLYGRNKKH